MTEAKSRQRLADAEMLRALVGGLCAPLTCPLCAGQHSGDRMPRPEDTCMVAQAQRRIAHAEERCIRCGEPTDRGFRADFCEPCRSSMAREAARRSDRKRGSRTEYQRAYRARRRARPRQRPLGEK